MNSRAPLGIALAVWVFCIALAGQTTATIDINTTATIPIHPNFSGINDDVGFAAEYWDYRLNTLAAKVGYGWLRFPAGAEGDIYNWQTGQEEADWFAPFANLTAGPSQGVIASVFGKGGAKLIDAANRANFLGATLIICANGFTDSPESIGRLAAYVKANNISVGAWELANEAYLFPEFFVTATAYLDKMKPYRDAIKAVDPNAVVAIFVRDLGNAPAGNSWDQAIAAYPNKYWDAITFHHYPPQSSGAFTQWMADETAALANKTDVAVTSQLLPIGPAGVKFLVTEFDPSIPNDSKTGAVPITDATLWGGIYASEFLMRMSTVPGMLYAGPHSLIRFSGVLSADAQSRQFYERNYYATLYQAVKTIDPNHLYLGNWILPRTYPSDWPIIAANCDVIGFDFYSLSFNDPAVQQLIQSTGKPVLVGEFSYPATYGGVRGFGSQKYSGPLTDAAAGDLYSQWLHDTSANPYVVGVEWFEYRDEPISGRGNNGGESNVSSALVLGEDYAFGMIDVTDRPKYDLVNKVRAANVATLAGLGLLGPAPLLSSAPANGATYETGGLVAGSWAQVKGTNLSDVSRIWQNADFANLGNKLPTDLSGVEVLVNGTAAAVYYVSPAQISFQVPAGISGSANVQVIRDGLASNTMSAPAVAAAPGIFPVIINGTNYAAGVFPDGKIAGDPSSSSAFRKAKPGDVIELFATGLAPSPGGVQPNLTPINGVTVTVGGIAVPAEFAGLVAVGEFQINFKVPQQLANMPEGNYPITISVNGVSSPATIASDPAGPFVLPIQH